MSIFDPMRDFFHRRAAKDLNERAGRVHLVTESTRTFPGSFVFPGTDTVAGIQVDGQRIGYVDYGINPLGDRLYIHMIKVEIGYSRQGVGLSALWKLWMTYQVPIVPIHQYAHVDSFWNTARQRFAAAGALIDDQLHSMSELETAKQRWQHLVPEDEHRRKIRELKASPGWPAIKAKMEAEYGPCLKD